MHEVLSSRNLFLDSSDGVGQGDNFTLELSRDSITAGDGQQLKLTLINFKLYTVKAVQAEAHQQVGLVKVDLHR